MLRVGLTGGLASGKTFVGEKLQELGCYLIKADELGHATLEPGGEAYEPTIREFGGKILTAEGRINRRLLAAEVFDNPARLAILNSFVHPAVRARTRRLTEEFAQLDPHAIVVNEAAILIETGAYKNFDRLIVAACREEQQIERAMHRDGLSRDEAEARLRRQLPLADKLKVADFVVDTSGSKEETAAQTLTVWEALRSIKQ
jgi:dephospho-CoA kinase